MEGPKKPLTGYLIFVNNNRNDVSAKNPLWKNTEVVSYLGALWNKLSEAQKQPFLVASNQDRERYNRELAQFKQNNELGKQETNITNQGQLNIQ